jgi:hypothetical protein
MRKDKEKRFEKALPTINISIATVNYRRRFVFNVLKIIISDCRAELNLSSIEDVANEK